MRAGILACIMMMMPNVSQAASFYTYNINGRSIIEITGMIDRGDSAAFGQYIAGLRDGVVVLQDSPGGLILEAMTIGDTIQAHNFSTLVLQNRICASACALIWLAGKPRVFDNGALIGFHAVSNSPSDAQISGSGNALVGAYLARLNLPSSAIFYITYTSPASITWLSVESARQNGIEMQILSASQAATNPPVVSPNPTNNQPSQATAEANPSFQQGRDARIAFNAWFDPIPEGEYRNGALFWIGNRSLPTPPSCNQAGMSIEWERGCNDAHYHLKESDTRRKSDPNFKLGWNSL